MWKSKKFILILVLAIVALVGGTAGAVMAATDDGGSQPTVTAIDPTSGWPGETLDVMITGTDFTGATSVNFSETGITVNSYTVDSATQVTADVTIANNATLGTSDVSVTTSAGTGTLSGSFTVETRREALLDRVCQIYQENTGNTIDPDQLQTAFDQARDEMQEQALENRLQAMVDNGKITQDEADQYLEWWQSRPDIEVPGLIGGGFEGGMMGGGGHNHWGPPPCASDDSSGTGT